MEHKARDCSETMLEDSDGPKLHIPDHPKDLRRGKDKLKYVINGRERSLQCYSRSLTAKVS